MMPAPLPDTAAGAAAPPRVLLVDIEPAMAALIAEWLRADGIAAQADDGAAAACADLVLVDVPFPRQDGPRQLQALAARLPGVPIVALSPTFFAGAAGSVARQLGVAAVLASPVRREALLAAVRPLLDPPP